VGLFGGDEGGIREGVLDSPVKNEQERKKMKKTSRNEKMREK